MNQKKFTPIESAILQLVQKNIPDSLEPYADIAKRVGTTEEEVLRLLKQLKEDGSIRRFGASIKHQKAGITENAMVAWIVTPEQAEIAGEIAAKHPMVSHCYYRPSTIADWPYELYTMIHGQNAGECEQLIEELKATTPLKEYAVLKSLSELKKTSMTYF